MDGWMDGWGRLVPCTVKIQILWEKRAVGRCIMTVCLTDSPLKDKFSVDMGNSGIVNGSWSVGKECPEFVHLLRKDKN